jgi:hypothetical protein
MSVGAAGLIGGSGDVEIGRNVRRRQRHKEAGG